MLFNQIQTKNNLFRAKNLDTKVGSIKNSCDNVKFMALLQLKLIHQLKRILMKKSLLFIALASFTLGINAANTQVINVFAKIKLPASMEPHRESFGFLDTSQQLQKAVGLLNFLGEAKHLGNLQPTSIPEAQATFTHLDQLINNALTDPLVKRHFEAKPGEMLKSLTGKKSSFFRLARYATRAKILAQKNLMGQVMPH